MAAWTAAQLRNAALEHLGIVGGGQSADAHDADIVDKAWVSVHAQLDKTGMVSFAVGAVPDWAKEPLTKYLAGQVAVKFGFTGPRLQAIGQDAGAGYHDLRVQMAGEKQPRQARIRSY